MREARESEGLSQRQLSAIMSRSNAYISLVESKRLNATVLDLIGFVVALKRPLKYFLPLDEVQDEEITGDEWELLTQYRKLKDEAIRKTAIKQIKELTKLETQRKEQ